MPQEVKVRYLAQGILTIPNEDLPTGWEEMTPKEKWEWVADVWWGINVTYRKLAHGLEDCDSGASEVNPGLLEVLPRGDDDYETIAQTNEYHQWWNAENATVLHEPEAPQ